jgi:hypothetical protein
MVGKQLNRWKRFLRPLLRHFPWTACMPMDRGEARAPRGCPAPGADQARCARDRKYGPTIRTDRTEPSRPAGVKDGRQAGQPRQVGQAATERGRERSARASKLRARAGAPPGTSKDGGWGADYEHPRGFFHGRGGSCGTFSVVARNYAAQSADNASACWSTVCTATSCKSGG